MVWEYYYDEDSDETTYYHEQGEVATLNGKNTIWRNGLPYGNISMEYGMFFNRRELLTELP